MLLEEVNTTNQLKQALSFDEDDIRANRVGELSDGQKRRLSNQTRARAGCFGIVFLIVLVISGVLMLTGQIAPGMGVTIPVVLLGLAMAGWLYREHRAVQGGMVASISGQAELSGVGDDEYRVTIGGTTFRVLEREHDAFEENEGGTSYTVYYLPGSKTIVSVELHAT